MPTHSPETHAKISATLKARGIKPLIRFDPTGHRRSAETSARILAAHLAKRLSKVCAECSKSFTVPKSASHRRFCSRACTLPFLRERQLGSKSHFWKGGVKQNPSYDAFIERRRQLRKLSNGGSHTLKEWIELKDAHARLCAGCGDTEPNIKLTEDHIIPVSKGGNDDISNIQPLCTSCNSRKNNRILEDVTVL